MNRKQRSTKRRESTSPRLVAELERAWESACDAHRAGDLATARAGYLRILARQPRHADARHLLGFASFQAGEFPEAVAHLEAAVVLRPESAEFHNNLALSLAAIGQIEPATQHAIQARQLGHEDGHGFLHVGWEFARQRHWSLAEQTYRLALVIQPETAEPHNYLGALYAAQSRWTEAIDAYQTSLRLCPDFVEPWNNLGNVYREQERLEEAVACYERAIQLDPRFAVAHNNLGLALSRLGQSAEAVDSFRQALRWEPQFAEAWNNLGNACCDLGRAEDAREHYRQALQFRPESAEIRCNLGACERQLRKWDASVATLRAAVLLQPDSIKIHEQLGISLTAAGNLEAAIRCWRHLESREPDQPLWSLRVATSFPTVFANRTEMDQFQNRLLACLANPAWRDWKMSPRDWLNHLPACPFGWQFFEHNPRPMKQAFAAVMAPKLANLAAEHWIEGWRGPRSRPRVGFVVTDHHEGIFLKSLGGVLRRWSTGWDLVIFCSTRGAQRIQMELGRSDIQIAPLTSRLDLMAQGIADARCDLLYYWEVGTDAANYYLPFLRLAPVQVTSWGVQVTSGIANLDAYLSNVLVEPRDAADHYSERLLLANTLLTHRARSVAPAGASRAEFPLPEDAHWYVCAQQLGKFHLDFDEVLGEILRRDPRGVVAITGDAHVHLGAALRARFQRTLPDVENRIHILPRLDPSAYLSLLQLAEVLLDPLHFGGVNSTYDALSLNRPLVTLPSQFHRGRYTWGCYQKMNFFECVAADRPGYADLAVRLATNPEHRRALERRLSEATPVLFEDPFAVAEHERLFSELLHLSA